MKQRIITTVALWAALALVLVLFGELGGLVLLVLITTLTQIETRQMGLTAGGRDERPLTRLPELMLGWSILLGSYFSGEAEFAMVTGILLGIVALVPPVTCLISQREVRSVCARTLYLPWMLHFYVLALQSFDSLWVPIWLIAVAKFNDVGALLVGRKLGRHKMAPLTSPGKTWEGAVGGVLVGGLVGFVLGFVPDFQFVTGLTPGSAFEVALLLGPVAIVSDLSGSWLKRRARVKDSGTTIPGIGGMLDLIDSLLLVAPVGYGLLILASRVWN